MRTPEQIDNIISELRRISGNDCVEQFDAHDHHICLVAAALLSEFNNKNRQN